KPAEITGPDPRPERAPSLRHTAKRRMHDRLLRPEGKAPEKREIVREHITAVHPQPFVAPLAEEVRQPVPCDRRVLVVHEVQIVVEKKERKRAALNYNRASVRVFRPLMFRECPDRDQGLAKPYRRQNVEPKRDAKADRH